MIKTMVQTLVAVAACVVAFLLMKPADNLPVLPDFIPSLYSHNHGNKNDAHSGNYYRSLLQPFCEAREFSQALPGAQSQQEYATTIYNLSYSKYKDRTEFFNSQIDWLIDCARKTGKLRVIINYNFYASTKQKKLLCETTSKMPSHKSGCPNLADGSPGYVPANIDDASKAFELLLGPNGPKNLNHTFLESEYDVVAGISLAEENVTWDYKKTTRDGEDKYVLVKQMRSDFLNALYNQLKQKYGQKYQFLQWYSPHAKLLNYPGLNQNWPVIDADGWVFDQYSMNVVGDQGDVQSGNYYQFVDAMANLEKPLYSIVWASPLRLPKASGRGLLNFEWWDANVYQERDGGWRSFYGQVAVNQKFGVHTLYYILTPDPSGSVKNDVFMTRSSLPHKYGLGLFEELVGSTLHYVDKNTISLEISETKPDWIVSPPKN